MSTNLWLGSAPAVAQVNTITVGGTPASGQQYAVTINGKSVTYTATGGDTNITIATALQLLLAASAIDEFNDATWTNPSNAVILGTSRTAGQPFTSTSSATGTGTLATQAGIATPAISSSGTATSGGTLTDSTTYYYKLTAINAAGETAASGEHTQATGVSGSNINTITLNWSAPAGTGITGYRIYRGTGTGTETLLATTGSSATSYIDTGTAAGATTPPTVNTTVSSGPNDISCPLNWSQGRTPTSSDDIWFQGSTVSAQYNLQLLAAVTPSSINVDLSFTGQVGLPATNTRGYAEYRQTYFQTAGSTGNIQIGTGAGQGSQRLRFDVGSTAATFVVTGMGTSIETGLPTLRIKGGASGSKVYVTKGTVGIALDTGSTAQVDTLDVGYQSNQAGDSTVICGTGTTLTTISQTGGTLTVNSAATTVTAQGGTLNYQAGNITTLNVQKTAKCYYTGTGTITAANVSGSSVFDFSRDMRGRTVTTLKLYSGATLNDPFRTLNSGAPVVNLEQCQISDVTLSLGTSISLTLGNAA